MLRKSKDISISKDDVDLFIKKRIEEEFEKKKRAATYLHEGQKVLQKFLAIFLP